MFARVTGLDRVAGGWWWLRIASAEIPFKLGQYRRIEHGGHRYLLPLTHASHHEGWIGGLMPPGSLPPALAIGSEVTLDPVAGTALPICYHQPPLLFAEGAGIGPTLVLAQRCEPPPRLVILGTWRDIPARLSPSRFLLKGMPPEAIAGVRTLEAAAIPARVASMTGTPGCFEGEGIKLLRHYLAESSPEQQAATALVACVAEGRLTPWITELEELFSKIHLAELPSGDYY